MPRIRFVMLLIITVIGATGCSLPGKPLPPSDPPATLPVVDLTLVPDPVLTPRVTPDLGLRARIEVVGEEEVVFDWGTDRCDPENIPDLPLRAFRDAHGTVQMLITHWNAFRMTGPDLEHLTIDCDPVFKSFSNPDPAMYNDKTWIASVYTTDGETVYALGHNEYQGNAHPGQCPQNEYFPCWYNTITLLISTDGGQSFQPAVDPPGNFVAGLPVQYQAGDGPYGLRAPSNIVEGPDGFFYAFVNLASVHSEQQYVCALRTKDLGDPASWRFWDGAGFSGRFIDPYIELGADPEEHLCQPFALDQIGAGLNDSVTYNQELELFVMVGLSADQLDGREVWGVYYSLSRDLLEWTRRKLLLELPLPWTVDDGGNDLSYLYPSLIDPDSTDLNFGTVDNEAFLYYTRNNYGHGSLDRDLVRVPVRFVP